MNIKHRGYTLIELTVALCIFSVLMISCMQLLNNQSYSATSEIIKYRLSQSCSKALEVTVDKVNENKSHITKDSIDVIHKSIKLGNNFLVYNNHCLYYNNKIVVSNLDNFDIRLEQAPNSTSYGQDTTLLRVYCTTKSSRRNIKYTLSTYINLDKNLSEEDTDVSKIR